MSIEPIAYARNGFVDKFGIPRQSRPDSVLTTRIEMAPGYDDRNMLRGIEEYSHLWLIWGFSEAESWSATVRPPRLGGNERRGVLATRSPYRPNHLGLTSVELVAVEGTTLIVRGADLMDSTPVYDIKPYVSYSDSHPEAKCSFASEHQNDRLTVNVEELAVSDIPQEDLAAIKEIVAQDPRPGYQDDPERIYKLDYGKYAVSFRVQEKTAKIVTLKIR